MEKEQYWSRFADDFEERNNYVIGCDDMAYFLNVIKQQKDLKNTLELGCGNGTYSKVLVEEATYLTATDFSDEMVNAAKSRLKTFEKIKVEKADCFNLPYSDSSFDTVFMANLLHIIPDPEKAVAECKRVLKNGGRLIVTSFTFECMGFINKIILLYRYLKAYGKPSPFAQNLTLKKAEQMLANNDFKVEEAKLIGNKMKAVFIKGRT